MAKLSLAQFKDKHKGEDMYVLASGKSFDYYDRAFFEGRLTIGVNQMPMLIPCTYGVRKEIPQKLLSNCISSTVGPLFLTAGSCGGLNGKNRDLITRHKNGELLDTGRVVLFEHEHNRHVPPTALPESDNALVVTHSTITTAIHLAAHMGARSIFIVGHDCGTLDGEINCEGYHTEITMRNWHEDPAIQKGKYKHWLGKIESQTVKIRKLITEKYGCQVVSLSPFVGIGMEGHTYQSK